MASDLNNTRVVTSDQPHFDILVRRWEEKDLPNTVELYRKFAEYQGLPVHSLTIEKLKRDGFCEHPWYYGFLAETSIQGKLVTVGIAVAMRCFPLQSILSINCLYIPEDWRGLGIEVDLVRAVNQLALNLECRLVHWIGDEKSKSIEELADYVSKNWAYYRMTYEDMLKVSK